MITVAAKRAEDLTSGNQQPRPEGSWKGRILKVDSRDFPKWAAQANKDGKNVSGYASSDGEEISLDIGENSAMDPAMDPYGNQHQFVQIVVRDGEHTLSNVDVDAQKFAGWKLQRSVPVLANLAIALGQTSVINGEVTFDADQFVHDLIDNKFNIDIGYQIKHRKVKAAVYPEITTFFPVS